MLLQLFARVKEDTTWYRSNLFGKGDELAQKLGLGAMCYSILNFLTIPWSKSSLSLQLLLSAVQTDNEIVFESSIEMNHCCRSMTLRLTQIQRWQIFSSKHMNSKHLWKSESASKSECTDQCCANFVKLANTQIKILHCGSKLRYLNITLFFNTKAACDRPETGVQHESKPSHGHTISTYHMKRLGNNLGQIRYQIRFGHFGSAYQFLKVNFEPAML